MVGEVAHQVAHFGVPRQLIVPRPGGTLLDAARARILESEGLSLTDMQGDAEGLIARFVTVRDANCGSLGVSLTSARERRLIVLLGLD